jgi:hypothetical protein
VTPDQDPPREVQSTGFRALNDRRDSDMTRTSVKVLVLEAVIIVGLVIIGKMFS